MKWNFLQMLTGKPETEPDTDLKVQTLDKNDQSSVVQSLIDIGIRKVDGGDFQGAIHDLSKAIVADPNNAEAYIYRGQARKALNDDKGANQDFNIARILFDKLDAGLNAYDKAIERYEADDFKGAIEYFSKSIALNVITSGTYYYRGLSKEFIDDIKGALQDYDKAIELNQDYKDAYHDRGRLKFYSFKDYEGALSDFDQAIRLSSCDEEFYISRAKLKSSMKNPEGAIQDYNKAIELNPSNTLNHFSRAIQKYEIQEYDGAIKDLDIVIELGLPEDSDIKIFSACSLCGGIKMITGDFEGAIIDFSKAIEIEPENGEMYFERAEARIYLGQTELGFEDKLKAYQLGYVEE